MSKKKTDLQPFHDAVCERDAYICQTCTRDFSFPKYFDDRTGRNQYVCGHHLDSQGAHPESKLDPDVGECVCFECHNLIHKGWDKEKIKAYIWAKYSQKSEPQTIQQPKVKREKYWGPGGPPKAMPKTPREKKKKGSGKVKLTHYYCNKTKKLQKF